MDACEAFKVGAALERKGKEEKGEAEMVGKMKGRIGAR
jgi:hypothetical protein